MSLSLVTHLHLVVGIFYKCKSDGRSTEFVNLKEFTKIIQKRDPVSIIRKLESQEVYQPLIVESM